MKTFATTILMLALAAALPALAAGPQTGRADALRTAQEQLARQARETKGAPQQRALLERARIQRMLDDLEAGRAVDPAQIDRALEQTR
jgi:hypothetical protein